jgi:hypothetical protein
MTNPVKQNAGQIPQSTTSFFEADGRTVSAPWRAYLRTLGILTNASQGGVDLGTLAAQVNKIAGQVAALDAETTELQLLAETDPAAALFSALVARISVLEADAMAAPVPVPARHIDTLPDPVMFAPRMPASLPEPVFPARRDSDDLRKLLENV